MSEMNAMGVHLVWNDFVFMAGIADLKWRREESRIASGDVSGEVRYFPGCVNFTLFIGVVGAEMGEMP